ncbi:MAG: hypothetical protein ACAH83_01710 [Alphaproteobacteria bacterium]
MAKRPMGIAASFANVTFKKDDEEIYTARVSNGGCLGRDKADIVINRAYAKLKQAIDDGELKTSALDFNRVSVGRNEFEIATPHGADRIAKSEIKHVSP